MQRMLTTDGQVHDEEAHPRSALLVGQQRDQHQQVAQHDHEEERPEEGELLGLWTVRRCLDSCDLGTEMHKLSLSISLLRISYYLNGLVASLISNSSPEANEGVKL